MELARQPRTLQLLCLEHAPDGVAADPLREVDGDGCPRGERLGQAELLVREGSDRSEAVVCDDHPDALPSRDERNVERRADPEQSRRVLVDLGILDERIDPFAPRAVEDAAGLGARALEQHSRDAVIRLAGHRGDAKPVGLGQGDENEPRVHELA